jgi:hypothetical protein
MRGAVSLVVLGVLQVVAVVFASGAVSAKERLLLVQQGQARATIVRGRDDAFAARQLAEALSLTTGVKIRILKAEDRLPDRGVVVLVGSPDSNPLVRWITAEVGLKLDAAALTDQGYLAKRINHAGRDWVILAGGGRDGSQYAVVDLKNWHLLCKGRDVWLDDLDTRQVPRFRYRWLWTWDNRMDWGGPGTPVTVMGGGKYPKPADSFLIDYKHCIDFMAEHKFNGLIVWGFLRDNHGGVEAARELCRYAAERGVRILPGVGTSGYSGYYYQGNNRFNAETWMAEHPELRALDAKRRPHNAPCPSKKANQDWLDQGARWLFTNFEIGGVNLEMGDFFVCYCDDCQRARAAIHSTEPDYYKDMAISHRVTLQTMRRLAPQAWLSYATYTGYTAAMQKTPPQFLTLIPDDAICQWTLTGMTRRWPAAVRPLAKHNLGYLHWCNSSTHTQEDLYLDEIQAICRQAAAAGFEGLDTYGELSDQRPNAALFYLAWEAFLWQPDMSVEEFIEQRLGRLFGGPKAARALLEIIPLARTRSERGRPGNLARARTLAESARAVAGPGNQERWDRLIGDLSRLAASKPPAAKDKR